MFFHMDCELLALAILDLTTQHSANLTSDFRDASTMNKKHWSLTWNVMKNVSIWKLCA
jgi:hypothetical protein